MPTYEYRCTECGHQYETREGFDAPSTHPCPKCHGESRRVLYAPPILFKASGFYVTDNRKGGLVGASSTAGSDGDGDKEIASVEAAKPAETKPAAKKSEKSSEATAAG